MIIRQSAFETDKKLLKGALHCHTTRSDGVGDPADVIALHHANGYDFMALTDHRYYNYENYSDKPMTIIPGMELDANFPSERGTVHCHHIVCIGPEKSAGNGFEQDQRFESVHISDPAETQPMIDMAHAANNLTIYCHPEWSGTPACDFKMLRGNFAMEIWNSGCAIENELDTNAAYWDELLCEGQRIFGVATDDGHAMNQHCKGWVRVNAENNIPAILDALQNGRFYSSCGPEIYDFYIEDGVVHVKSSPVVQIGLRHLRVPYRVARPASDESTITEASFPLRFGPGAHYVRAFVVDAAGHYAWSNPLFVAD